MKIFTIQLENLSSEPALRFDCDYHQYKGAKTSNSYVFGDLFDFVATSAVSVNDLYKDFRYCEIGDADKNGDISPVLLNFENRDLINDNYYKKIEKGDIISASAGDILLSKVRPNLRKFIRITPDIEDCYFTNAFIALRPKRIPIILYYCLRTIFFTDIISISRQGKGYPTLNEKDLRLLQFDKAIVDKLEQQSEKLTLAIIKLEQSISNLKAKVQPIQAIIDSVFARDFDFDYATFEDLKTHKRFHVDISSFANNPDLRFSAKFHRNAGAFVMQQLQSITKKKIKHYLAEPIVLGASVSPADYTDDGDYYYISMATIKDWQFNAENANFVSQAYSETKQTKTVSKDDILMARSGEGTIGKVALIDNEDLQGVFADFIMRIRLKNYNSQFAYYYLRTKYFQYLVEVYKKGLGNNTNIFPTALQEFPIPDISFSEQQRIVDEIQTEIHKQDDIKTKIADLRKQIDIVIKNALK